VTSIPPPEPPPFRHLGSGNTSRPLRSPVALGLIALLVLVALPIYLFRHPKPIAPVAPDAAVRREPVDAGAPVDAAALATADAAPSKRVTLADPKVIRCIPRAGGRVPMERCDRLRSLEDTLVRAIRDNVACAPVSAAPFTVSYVLSVDFDRKKVHVWAGRSGSLKKRNAGDLVRCVDHAIGQPDLVTITHQYVRYEINVIASYPGVVASPAP
jgi:hypothetical protein